MSSLFFSIWFLVFFPCSNICWRESILRSILSQIYEQLMALHTWTWLHWRPTVPCCNQLSLCSFASSVNWNYIIHEHFEGIKELLCDLKAFECPADVRRIYVSHLFDTILRRWSLLKTDKPSRATHFRSRKFTARPDSHPENNAW